MIVMPANASGWFWHSLARETRKIGHLYSPGDQRGPWQWFPYALDNGAYSCWVESTNEFDEDKWAVKEVLWNRLIHFWVHMNRQKPLWAIVPDRPGGAEDTFLKWSKFAGIVQSTGIPIALAVQNGMTPNDVRQLNPPPDVICVGGSTEWKWETLEMWVSEFRRVHLLRCNKPSKLDYLEYLGVESCDGTGWLRDGEKADKLEKWARGLMNKHEFPLHPYVCRETKRALRVRTGDPVQETLMGTI